MRELIWALKFLTVIPFDTTNKITTERYNVVMALFPVVGLIIGLVLTATCLLCSVVGFRDQFSITCCIVLLVLTLLTGALHVDGLADTVDGVLGGSTKTQRLEIMRDSRIGVFGTIAIILDYLLRFCALTEINRMDQFFILTCAALCLMPIIGRWCQSLGAAMCEYAREDEGTGKVFLDTVSWSAFFGGAVLPGALSVLMLGRTGLLMLIFTLIVTVVVILIIRHRIGGMTGDTLGAINEIAEVTFLVSFFCFYSPGAKLPIVDFALQFIKL